MSDSGVPCQLEFFRDFDFSIGERVPPPQESHHTAERQVESPPATPVHFGGDSKTGGAADPSISLPPFRSIDLTQQASELVANLGIKKLARCVSVIWNRRMRTAAGRAFYDSQRIELNPGLLRLSEIDIPAEVDRTLRHELAHLVAFHRARGRKIAAHGPEWQEACHDLGIPGEARCHSLPFKPRRVRKKLVYECPRCDTKILRVRRFRQAVACHDCCRLHGDGRYDDRFRLVARKLVLS